MNHSPITFAYEKTAGVDIDTLEGLAGNLIPYLETLREVAKEKSYQVPESSINLPFDTEILEEVRSVANKKKNDQLRLSIVSGIGGSNLGAMAVYEALLRGNYCEHRGGKNPTILFADTVSPLLLKRIGGILEREVKSPDEVLLNVVTKSGTTMETIANAEALYSLLQKRFSQSIHNRVVLTTDRDSKLWNIGEEKGFTLLPIPELVGGRYSVFSVAGLFPLLLAGVDVEDLLKGACDMRDQCLNADMSANTALMNACILFAHYKKGITMHNTFFFNPELETIGKWYRQLMGESLGKERNAKGEVVHAGITPLVSIGSADLHSMAQLYFGGPRDKFTTFVHAKETSYEARVPNDFSFGDLVSGIAGKSFEELMAAIVGGVEKAYERNELPFAKMTMPGVSAYTLGQYLQYNMMMIMFLAHLMGVNPFDQPNVEDYKKETKNILKIT